MLEKNRSHRAASVILATLLGCGALFPSVFAATENIVGYQKSTGTGSNSSVIETVSTDASDPVHTQSGSESAYTSVANEGDDTSTVGNSFRGYYYDSVYGFFRMDWSTDVTQNVRITEPTDKCASIGAGGYGYKLGGYAKSESAGFIRFDYSPSVFVYYCEWDGKLHGYAYGDTVGYQNFEGIAIDITGAPSVITSSADPFFSPAAIQNESTIGDPDQEIFFYVIK